VPRIASSTSLQRSEPVVEVDAVVVLVALVADVVELGVLDEATEALELTDDDVELDGVEDEEVVEVEEDAAGDDAVVAEDAEVVEEMPNRPLSSFDTAVVVVVPPPFPVTAAVAALLVPVQMRMRSMENRAGDRFVSVTVCVPLASTGLV
jgi:hypothetical protein